jgi:hypothetical protein
VKSILISSVVLNMAAGTALAGEKCDVPVADWQPREVLRSRLEAVGWRVRAIKAAYGCYEAFAVDEKGRSVEAYFNPKTFEPVGKAGDGRHG